MLTYEIILKVFAEYLNMDTDYEVILTSRGYTVMGWDNHRKNWSTAEFCATPESMRDALLIGYASFRETMITAGICDMTTAEKDQIRTECQALLERCASGATI